LPIAAMVVSRPGVQPRRGLGAVPLVWPVMLTAVTGLADAVPRPVEAAAG
jgi:hypothetical protein